MYCYFTTCLSQALEAHKDVLNKKTCKLVIICTQGHVTKSSDTALQATATMKFTKTMRASGSVKVLDIKTI